MLIFILSRSLARENSSLILCFLLFSNPGPKLLLFYFTGGIEFHVLLDNDNIFFILLFLIFGNRDSFILKWVNLQSTYGRDFDFADLFVDILTGFLYKESCYLRNNALTSVSSPPSVTLTASTLVSNWIFFSFILTNSSKVMPSPKRWLCLREDLFLRWAILLGSTFIFI